MNKELSQENKVIVYMVESMRKNGFDSWQVKQVINHHKRGTLTDEIMEYHNSLPKQQVGPTGNIIDNARQYFINPKFLSMEDELYLLRNELSKIINTNTMKIVQ